MALVLADRVRDTTTTTGTGTVTLSGTAPTGYQNFSVIGNGNTCYYTINGGSQWEVGIGTYSSTGPTLARTTVLSSSNAGAAVDFAAGTKDVFVTYPAGKSVNYDASNNVGVGTTTPKTKLQASGAANLNAPALGSATNAPFYVTNSDFGYGLVAGTNATDGHVWLQAQRTDGAATAYNITLNEAGGNVGIGNTNPGYKLEVTGDLRLGSGGDLRLGSATGTTGSAGDSSIYSDANDMYLNTNNVTRMYIANGGNVGIGNTGPTYRLDVSAADTTAGLGYAMRIRANATAAGGAFQFTDSGATAQWGYLAATSTSVTLDASGSSVLAFRTNSNERMRITSAGDVGIGTSSPGAKLDVNGSSTTDIFHVTRGTTWFTVGVTDGSRVDVNSFQSGVGGKLLALQSAGGTASFGGNVGIGTTSPTSLLDVNGNAEIGGTLFLGSSNHGNLASDTNTLYLRGTNIAFQNAAGSGTYAYIDSSGDLGIGTTSPTYKLEVYGSPAWIRNFAGTPSSPTETQDWPVSAFNIASYGDFTLQTMLAFTLPNDGNYFLGYAAWNFKLDQTASSTTSAGVNGMQFGGPGYLLFAPGTTEKARITSGGALLVGTTAPLAGNTSNEYKTTTAGLWPLTLNSNDRGLLMRQSNGSSGYYAYFEYNSGTNNGSISWSGGTTAYNTTSDARIKKNIVDAPDAGALIDGIKVRSWDFKADNVHWRYGMVAQELLDVAPEAVSVPEDPEMMMGVDYAKLVPMLIKEVQSLRARVAQLEGK